MRDERRADRNVLIVEVVILTRKPKCIRDRRGPEHSNCTQFECDPMSRVVSPLIKNSLRTQEGEAWFRANNRLFRGYYCIKRRPSLTSKSGWGGIGDNATGTLSMSALACCSRQRTTKVHLAEIVRCRWNAVILFATQAKHAHTPNSRNPRRVRAAATIRESRS